MIVLIGGVALVLGTVFGDTVNAVLAVGLVAAGLAGRAVFARGRAV